MTPESPATHGFRTEFRLMLKRAAQVWRLVPRSHKFSLSCSTVLMTVTAACGTMIALLVGELINQLRLGGDEGWGRAEMAGVAGLYLAFLAGTYILREFLNVVRRFLAENTCTKIEKDMTVRLINHLMRVDLATLTTEKVGALHGRIQRSVVGFVRFLRICLMEFLPAVLTGVFALLATVTKQPVLGLVMVGVIPISVYL